MSAKYDAFVAALAALCEEHGVWIDVTEDLQLRVNDGAPTYEDQRAEFIDNTPDAAGIAPSDQIVLGGSRMMRNPVLVVRAAMTAQGIRVDEDSFDLIASRTRRWREGDESRVIRGVEDLQWLCRTYGFQVVINNGIAFAEKGETDVSQR